MTDPRVDRWLESLEERHLANLRFSEVTRALRALSLRYVQRRDRLTERGAFDTAGKRAAYALYYSPLHFMTVSLIAEAIVDPRQPMQTVVDLGCGCGGAGAAWARRRSSTRVIGIDSHPWAIGEAALTYRTFELEADMRRAQAERAAIPRSGDAIVVGWMLNELTEAARTALRDRLLERVRAGAELLVVEPIATRVSPWWSEWVGAFEGMRSRADEWRFNVELPDLLMRLDRAAGLRHNELKARSLYVTAERNIF